MKSSLSLSIKTMQEVLDAKQKQYEAESKKLPHQDGADYEKTKTYTEQLLEEIQGLEKKLEKLNHQKDNQATTELLKILRPYDEEISPQVFKAYTWALGPRAIAQPQPDLETLIRDLDNRFLEPGETYTALQKFVAYLRSPTLELPLPLTQALKDWIENNGVKNPNELDRQIEAAQATRQQQSSCLLVKVSLSQQQSASRQTKDRYFVKAWYIQDRNAYREKFPAGAKEIRLQAITIRDSSAQSNLAEEQPQSPPTYTEDEICQTIQQLRQVCADGFGNPDSIHIFLPRQLMTSTPDQWPHRANKTRPLFGTRHQVVLRCGDRIYGNYELSREWGRKWQALERLLNQAAAAYIKDADPTDPDVLYGTVEDYSDLVSADTADVVGVKLTEHLHNLEDDESLEILITESALPLALWLRQNPDNSPCVDALNQVLKDCLLQDIPDKIRRTRIDAVKVKKTQPCHVGNHLVLVWDDPYLVPPDAQQPQSA